MSNRACCVSIGVSSHIIVFWMFICLFFFFFFKQKTAYEIDCDWSSDVCSSDLVHSHLGSAFADSESLHDLAEPKNYALNLTARLRPGLTIETAKARVASLTQRFNAIQPSNAEGARDLQLHEPSRFSISTSPEDDGRVTLIGTLLMGMTGAGLVIARLSLGNMLLARGTARSKEIALRLAVGASRWRIVRQLLCEGLLLAI